MWELTIPQLNYYLKQCNEHIEFTIKVHSFSFGGLFGGSAEPANKEQSQLKESANDHDYQAATDEDMKWLASIL